MSSETITTALFLITTVVAASVLIMAIFPAISTMSGTFSSATHESDVRMRMDFKIIATYAYPSETAANVTVWMKNIGTESISLSEIQEADVFCGAVGSFAHMAHTSLPIGTNQWKEEFTPVEYDLNSNSIWDPGETLEIFVDPIIPAEGNPVYFQFALPNGIWRSITFTVS